jgi:hypothetical protein
VSELSCPTPTYVPVRSVPPASVLGREAGGPEVGGLVAAALECGGEVVVSEEPPSVIGNTIPIAAHVTTTGMTQSQRFRLRPLDLTRPTTALEVAGPILGATAGQTELG